MLERVKSFINIQVFEDHPVAGPSEIRSSKYGGSDAGLLEAGPIFEAHTEVEDSEETPDGS